MLLIQYFNSVDFFFFVGFFIFYLEVYTTFTYESCTESKKFYEKTCWVSVYWDGSKKKRGGGGGRVLRENSRGGKKWEQREGGREKEREREREGGGRVEKVIDVYGEPNRVVGVRL